MEKTPGVGKPRLTVGRLSVRVKGESVLLSDIEKVYIGAAAS